MHCPGQSDLFGEVARRCLGHLDGLSPGSLIRLLKVLAVVKMDNPVGFADILHDVAEHHLQRLHHSKLCGLLRSAVVAAINVAYTDCKAHINAATGRICKHLEELIMQLQPQDLFDVAASLALWQDQGGEQLGNIIRQRQSNLDEYQTRRDPKGLRRSHSITSLSTADDENDDVCPSTSESEDTPVILGHTNVPSKS